MSKPTRVMLICPIHNKGTPTAARTIWLDGSTMLAQCHECLGFARQLQAEQGREVLDQALRGKHGMAESPPVAPPKEPG